MTVADRSSQELWVCHLGVVPYRDALAIQEQVRARRQADELPDTLLLLEHPPVYTRGRRSGAEDLPLGEDFYRAKGIDVRRAPTAAGAHLPRPRPARRLSDHAHRRRAPLPAHDGGRDRRRARRGRACDARSRHDEGIDYTGVWVAERKIASIGVHVSRGVTHARLRRQRRATTSSRSRGSSPAACPTCSHDLARAREPRRRR